MPEESQTQTEKLAINSVEVANIKTELCKYATLISDLATTSNTHTILLNQLSNNFEKITASIENLIEIQTKLTVINNTTLDLIAKYESLKHSIVEIEKHNISIKNEIAQNRPKSIGSYKDALDVVFKLFLVVCGFAYVCKSTNFLQLFF